jgi:hypothetical protein
VSSVPCPVFYSLLSKVAVPEEHSRETIRSRYHELAVRLYIIGRGCQMARMNDIMPLKRSAPCAYCSITIIVRNYVPEKAL